MRIMQHVTRLILYILHTAKIRQDNVATLQPSVPVLVATHVTALVTM